MPSLSASPVMTEAQVEDHKEIVQNLEASLATLGYAHPHTDDHIHEMLALQPSLISAMTELVVALKRVAGSLFERERRNNTMDGVEDSQPCQARDQSGDHRGDILAVRDVPVNDRLELSGMSFNSLWCRRS